MKASFVVLPQGYKPSNEPTPIETLKNKCQEAVDSCERQGRRNKLSQRDMTHLRVESRNAYYQRKSLSIEALTQEANRTKTGPARVSTSTVWRSLDKLGLACDLRKGSLPRELAPARVPRWLAQRRSFCTQFRKQDIDHLLMADESFFGFSRKMSKWTKEIHPTEAKLTAKYEPYGANRRVTVWGAVGFNYYTDIFIFEHGKYLNGQEYAELMDNHVLPDLRALQGKVSLIEDNCRIHIDKRVKAVWQASGLEHRFLGPYWHDLNWQEKVWAHVKQEVYKGRSRTFTTKDELEAAIRRAWTKVVSNDDYRRRLVVEYMAVRKSVFDAQGFLVHCP
jgi:hypothetical protein